MIPSLAIHMNRDINGGYHYNVQKDMLPFVQWQWRKGNSYGCWQKRQEIRPKDILEP